MAKQLPATITIPAKPFGFNLPTAHTALLAIDLQRDFILPGGFGDIQSGTNLSYVKACVDPCVQLLRCFRDLGMPVVHTREGHVPDLSDCPALKLYRQAAAPAEGGKKRQHGKVIGDVGPMGRLLVRGEYGHDLLDEVKPKLNERVIDKPGKGAFWNTGLLEELQAMAVTHLVVVGVTTECCVTTTVREANDRGFECVIVEECTAGYNSSFKPASLDMIYWSDGLFGYVCGLADFLGAFSTHMVETNGYHPSWNGSLDLDSLEKAYRSGVSPTKVVESVFSKIAKADSAAWIYVLPKGIVLEAARKLEEQYPDKSDLPPLFGVPFSIKDSIDLAGIPTTTACPQLEYVPASSSGVVAKLISLGALPIGKANLDQLATGLTGCRSPYGVPRSVFNREYISGGSSSGSAVSVGADLVSFAVATDTAGSGRVPSGFNGVVGFKPTKGTISFAGIVTACESLDCIALMSKRVEDVRKVWRLTRGYDPNDRMAKAYPQLLRPVHAIGPKSEQFRFSIPPAEVLTVCSEDYLELFHRAVDTLKSIGGELVEVDWTPFRDAGNLLYDGSFVSERIAGLPEGWIEKNLSSLHSVIREIFQAVLDRKSTAADVYRDLHKVASCKRKIREEVFNPSGIIVMVVPTAPRHPTVNETLAAPITTNTFLGTFTHFGNVLDLCAAAVPAGTYDLPGGSGVMPFSITMLGGERTDADVLNIAQRFEEQLKMECEF